MYTWLDLAKPVTPGYRADSRHTMQVVTFDRHSNRARAGSYPATEHSPEQSQLQGDVGAGYAIALTASSDMERSGYRVPSGLPTTRRDAGAGTGYGIFHHNEL